MNLAIKRMKSHALVVSFVFNGIYHKELAIARKLFISQFKSPGLDAEDVAFQRSGAANPIFIYTRGRLSYRSSREHAASSKKGLKKVRLFLRHSDKS